MGRLDKIFDIIKCTCPILLCGDFGCSGCPVKAHCKCTCPPNRRIPLNDLPFVMDQRMRSEDRPSLYQIQNIHLAETAALREKERKKAKKHSRQGLFTANDELECDNCFTDNSSHSSSAVHSESGISYPLYSKPKKLFEVSDWHQKILSTTAMESERFGVSNRATAANCTAFLLIWVL